MSTTRLGRNWKHRWDPSADFVYLKRLRMGDDPQRPFVLPGDRVSDAERAKLGLARLRRWFEAGVVGLSPSYAQKQPAILQARLDIRRGHDEPESVQELQELFPIGDADPDED